MAGGMFQEVNRFFQRYLTPAARWILFINMGVLLFQYIVLVILGGQKAFLLLFSQIPYYAVMHLQVWRFATYMFLHAGGMHLLFNMLPFWFFAPRLETRWGTQGFLKFYFVCGIGAAIVHALYTFIFGDPGFTPDGEVVRGLQPMVGASGAIYGILLAYALYWPDETVLLNFFIPIKVKYMVLIFGLLEFMATIGQSGSNISHITHLGGLLAAFLYLRGWRRFRGGPPRGGLFGKKRRPKRMVKRYYRDDDGRIYIDFEEE